MPADDALADLIAAKRGEIDMVPLPGPSLGQRIRARLDELAEVAAVNFSANSYLLIDALRAVLELAAAHGLCHFQPCDQRVGCPSLDVLDLLAEHLGVAG